MTPQYLIVDSCSYLRLASQVHPSFWGGHAHYELRSIAETDPEIAGTRLLSKFVWPNRDPHPGLRKRFQLRVGKDQARAIKESEPFLLEHAEEFLDQHMAHRRKMRGDGEELPFLSPTDLTILATAYHFGYGILTDELALGLVAKDLSLAVLSSLQMLRYLLDQKLIDDAKVDSVILRWHESKDLPHRGWASEFKLLFKRPAPASAVRDG